MKKVFFMAFLLIFLTLGVSHSFAEQNTDAKPWNKYPDNSEKNFMDVDVFYDSLDKNLYKEYQNAELNIREKVFFKDINKVFEKADKHGSSRISGDGYHPQRQVYVFVTVSKDGKHMTTAVFDAEKQRLISASKG
ncbi:hypothetical protein [Cytobacillus purgationiresistens]|uniref:DUF3887 domain-containing protein n=1 Tax=Cytobacillus purgationiresistens TaxID=863449 RepID=A0ABU0AFU2_9BACI|nr:hypothetical protein [Cytobacillus purgationiresistens]MDQ0270113.1 hypothetical protein [Cytobacillus purgationiresistens]